MNNRGFNRYFFNMKWITHMASFDFLMKIYIYSFDRIKVKKKKVNKLSLILNGI